jgi:hypothetical protein
MWFLGLLNLNLIGSFLLSLIKCKGTLADMQAKGMKFHNPFGAFSDTFALNGRAG